MIPLKNEIYHACTLEVIPDVIPSKLHPNTSRSKKFCDRCKRYVILSPSNYKGTYYFRSRFAVMKERQRQLSTPSYRYIIHPFSKFAQFREITMTIIWSILLFIDPMMGTFALFHHVQEDHVRYKPGLDKSLDYKIASHVQNVLGWMAAADIITNFFLGYVNKHTREVILEPRKIVRRYLLSYFFFDLLALIDSTMSIVLEYVDFPVIYEVIMQQQYIFRLARLCSVTNYFESCLRQFKMRDSAIMCTKIFVSTVFILHWWTCILAFIPLIYFALEWDLTDSWTIEAKVTMEDNRSIGARYVRFLMVVMCHFYGASRTSFWSTNAAELTTLSFIIVCGIGYYTYAIAMVNQLFSTANISETKYDELITIVKQYAEKTKLTVPLRNRLLLYYESKFQRRFFQENTILQSLSEHLRLEVTLYSCKHLIESVHVFQGLNKSAIGTMLSLLKQEIFLPGDEITSSLKIDKELYYFVSYGTVACMVVQHDKQSRKKKQIELMHLEDGDHFGESENNSDLDDATEAYCTVAIELSEIYTLTQRRLLKCKEMFPEFAVKIGRSYQRRKNYMVNFLRTSKEKSDADILNELAFGRILLHGRKRGY